MLLVEVGNMITFSTRLSNLLHLVFKIFEKYNEQCIIRQYFDEEDLFDYHHYCDSGFWVRYPKDNWRIIKDIIVDQMSKGVGINEEKDYFCVFYYSGVEVDFRNKARKFYNFNV